ncbi:hypothetical protein DPMN_174965 [Dreissena polymorpha]|uniref:Uncharacterized protein n=1 Tax=Dreissena polymorpha TaxID=45954 RepID=A0A9D4E5N5_DREPO|nr:hypothetical protein DPMN_174965 [Dreissena polymorpha]
MPCPFESDMVLIPCRSTGVRDAQEEKDTSSINGTCHSSACFPGLYQPLSRSLHPPRSGPCSGCCPGPLAVKVSPVADVQVPTPYAVKVPPYTEIQVPHSTAVQVPPTAEIQVSAAAAV